MCLARGWRTADRSVRKEVAPTERQQITGYKGDRLGKAREPRIQKRRTRVYVKRHTQSEGERARKRREDLAQRRCVRSWIASRDSIAVTLAVRAAAPVLTRRRLARSLPSPRIASRRIGSGVRPAEKRDGDATGLGTHMLCGLGRC